MFFILISPYPLLYQLKHFIFKQYLPVSDSFNTIDICVTLNLQVILFCTSLNECVVNIMILLLLNIIFSFLYLRSQILGQLKVAGFIRPRGAGDIRDLNVNSSNWAVVKV